MGVSLLAVVLVGILVAYLTPCQLTQESEALHQDDAEKDENKPPTDVLLPSSIIPEHYDIQLQPYLDPKNFTFDGKVTILLKCVSETRNITLHINDIKADESSIIITDAGGQKPPSLNRVSEDPLRQFYILHFNSPLLKGHRYELTLAYKGNLNDQLAGFYRSSYKDAEGNTRWLATTQFQPTDARRAFPCFDEPALKATFNITIIRWRNMTSISNMRIYKTEEKGQDWVVDYFESTVRMSTYLLAFIVSDFKSAGTAKFSIWSREEAINATSYALEIGPKILHFYEQFFDIEYPLPKTDMAAVPDFSAGAMENWGLITYRETALLYDPLYSSSRNKARVATVVSHELAHQWFGNLVTPKWWDDLWLNEGFASYVEYLGVDAVHPEWQMMEQFVLDLQDVMDLDCLKSSHPVSVPVGHPDEINEIFDRISYGKGSAIIRMMNHFLGNETFRTGLTNYLNAKKYDNAVQDDLWEFLTAAQTSSAKISVKEVMDSWTLQTGYPLVTVVRDYTAGTAVVNQTRFLLNAKDADNSTSYQWEVPLTYTDSRNPDWEPKTKLWLHKSNGTLSGLPGPNDWIMVNVKEVGYYRVNYDIQNWKMLINQLFSDHQKIHTVNRAQIIDDSMDLARAGLMNYHMALNSTLYLNHEKEYLPWKSALLSFGHMDSMLCRSAIYGQWKSYVRKQLEPLYLELGWNTSENENLLKQYLRESTLSWLCGYEYKDCIDTAKAMFQRWRENPTDLTIISPNLRGIVYCAAVRHGSQDVWDFLWQQYQSTLVASERDKFMHSLACAKEPWLLTRYLDWSMNSSSGIRRQDGSYVFRSVGSKLYGRDIAFNYLRDKWNQVFELYGKSFFDISGLLKSVTSSLNTQFELSQLKDFYVKNKNKVGAAKRAFRQAIENAEDNVRWMEANYADIKVWLEALQ